MKRILGRVVSIVAVAIVASAAAPACATNDESIYIRAVLAPPSTKQNGQCVFTNDPQQAALFEGLLDVGVRDSYTAVLHVGNQMIARGDPNAPRAESNRIHINGAVIRVTDPNNNALAGCPKDCEFTSFADGAVADPQTANTPSFIAASLIAIDEPTANTIAGIVTGPSSTTLVIANIKVFGKTLGGVDVESGEFRFPIRACNGCSVKFTNADYAPRPPTCARDVNATASASTEGGCFVGQDAPTNCEDCLDRLVCKPCTSDQDCAFDRGAPVNGRCNNAGGATPANCVRR